MRRISEAKDEFHEEIFLFSDKQGQIFAKRFEQVEEGEEERGSLDRSR
jgi:hypothetical protein